MTVTSNTQRTIDIQVKDALRAIEPLENPPRQERKTFNQALLFFLPCSGVLPHVSGDGVCVV